MEYTIDDIGYVEELRKRLGLNHCAVCDYGRERGICADPESVYGRVISAWHAYTAVLTKY